MSIRKTGRITPHAVPRLKFRDYVEEGAPKPPATCYRPDRQYPWKILANGPDPTVTNPIIARYGVGDCVIARILHQIQHAHISAGTPVPDFTGDDALKIYSLIMGFDPSQTDENGENPTDQGTDPNAADTYWKVHGIPLPGGGTDKLAAYLSVNPKDEEEIHRGIWENDGLGAGVELTESAERDSTWTVIPNDPGVGGHEFYAFSYDSHGVGINSWAELLHATYGYLAKQCDQLTVYLSEDQLKAKSGISDTGLNWDRLKQDFERYF